MGKDELNKIKEAIMQCGPLHPGKLSLQYTTCNKNGCACKNKINPKKHGPYYQLSYSIKGKSSTRFVKVEDVETVQTYINEYHKLKALMNDLSESYAKKFKQHGWKYQKNV